ncbi:response regulator transcription factor [Acetobacter ascendens]|uniref:DNA-binding response regulator n=1 Tax=Acetobacter ascendens TaxID=481146 RepID=A0A1D8QYE1_9PROT|nr:response regulator transcription factor [Acetobacter ascendens]RCL08864.1 DNA-binding response regulator [Acetobacter pasteurianus]GCD76159.1 two component response regulator CtrA [Acetobacter pasteurianus NBRC 3299]AOW47353.1 DNA-binding response regulator [Acetobacter ascendens]AOW48744.1 DNA-binding response regulator [Acetobacter ascendens]ARW10423.1 Transcriptional regulatory protein [Acetobacter ascendens]
MRILLLENNFTSSRAIFSALTKASFSVDMVRCDQEVIELLRNYDYGLAILHLQHPDIDGYNILSTLRSLKLATPVIVISPVNNPEVKTQAFAAGADDYLTDPFDSTELTARIQAILRRAHGYAHPIAHIGDLTVNLNSHAVTVKNQPIHLTGKEFSILELLVLRKGIAQTKETFLNHLYGGRDEPDIKIIDVFICKLRKKLQAAGAGNLISTVWGRGYILNDPQAAKACTSMPTLGKHLQQSQSMSGLHVSHPHAAESSA